MVSRKSSLDSKIHWRKKYPEANFVLKARERAREKGLDFNITRDDIILANFCPILGLRLDSSTLDQTPSIDRIDNNKGYIKGNIQIISFRANRMKGNATLDEIMLLADFLKGINGRN